LSQLSNCALTQTGASRRYLLRGSARSRVGNCSGAAACVPAVSFIAPYQASLGCQRATTSATQPGTPTTLAARAALSRSVVPMDPPQELAAAGRKRRRRGGVRNRKRLSSQKGLPPATAPPPTPASPPVKRRRKDIAGQAAAMPKRGNTSSLLDKVIYLTRMTGLEGVFSGAVGGLSCKLYRIPRLLIGGNKNLCMCDASVGKFA
jgi:hypothetical protein